MTPQESSGNSRPKLRRALVVVLPLLMMGGTVFGYLMYTGTSLQESAVRTGTNAFSSVHVEFAVTINHQEQRMADLPWLAQMALKGQFWSPSCYFNCNNGVSYYLDPVPFITNEGNDFIQCKLFDAATVLTCGSPATTSYATVIGVSTSATAMTVGDTAAGGTDACGSTLIATANGLGVAAGTVTAAGSLGSGSGTTQLSITTAVAHTFTDATAQTSSVQDACLLTATSGTTYLLAEGNFGPDTLAVGNTLTITWSMSVS